METVGLADRERGQVTGVVGEGLEPLAPDAARAHLLTLIDVVEACHDCRLKQSLTDDLRAFWAYLNGPTTPTKLQLTQGFYKEVETLRSAHERYRNNGLQDMSYEMKVFTPAPAPAPG